MHSEFWRHCSTVLEFYFVCDLLFVLSVLKCQNKFTFVGLFSPILLSPVSSSNPESQALQFWESFLNYFIDDFPSSTFPILTATPLICMFYLLGWWSIFYNLFFPIFTYLLFCPTFQVTALTNLTTEFFLLLFSCVYEFLTNQLSFTLGISDWAIMWFSSHFGQNPWSRLY